MLVCLISFSGCSPTRSAAKYAHFQKNSSSPLHVSIKVNKVSRSGDCIAYRDESRKHPLQGGFAPQQTKNPTHLVVVRQTDDLRHESSESRITFVLRAHAMEGLRPTTLSLWGGGNLSVADFIASYRNVCRTLAKDLSFKSVLAMPSTMPGPLQ